MLAQLPKSVSYPAVAAVGGLEYVIGGWLRGNQGDSTAVHVINVSTRTATIAARLPIEPSHAGSAVIGVTVAVFGGQSRRR